MPVRFHELKLGFASAEEEGASSPELLLDGFLDTGGLIREAREGSKFLYLGYKGSGKSAISEHLRLTAQIDSQLFVTNAFLSDFPYSDFKEIIKGNEDPETKYPTAWSWLLLLLLFGSFHKDQGSTSSDSDYSKAIEVLSSRGLLPTPSLRQVVLVSSKRSFQLKLPSFLQSTFERNAQEQDLQLPFLVERLKAIALKFKSASRHLLVIDGLDDILTSSKVQYESLAALVLEAGRLNTLFRQSHTPAKIILLCRTDLFERLPGANKNKFRQDSAVVLDWYHDTRIPKKSNLIKLTNKKARVHSPNIDDIFSTYFSHLQRRNQDIRTFLLEHTRHTPRDFIQLLTHIQQYVDGGEITNDQFFSGLRSYSINYFLPEIRDELVGYVPFESIDAIIELIGSLRLREFGFSDLADRANKEPRYSQLDLPVILRALFECSAIGNKNMRSTTHFYTFKFRNRNSSLSFDDLLVLHRGMWKAFNLV